VGRLPAIIGGGPASPETEWAGKATGPTGIAGLPKHLPAIDRQSGMRRATMRKCLPLLVGITPCGHGSYWDSRIAGALACPVPRQVQGLPVDREGIVRARGLF
jgi:hypothetical protein